MKIKLNSDEEIVKLVKKGLKDNDGFCPCKVLHLPENKCICEEFRNKKKPPVWRLYICGIKNEKFTLQIIYVVFL